MIDPTGGPGQAGQRDSTVVYDGGPRTVVSIGGIHNFTASANTLVAAAAGLRTKVLYFRASCTAFTTQGNIFLRDGAGGTSVLFMGNISALNQAPTMEVGGLVICQTSVNTLLEDFGSGTMTVHFQLIYYQAP